MKKLIFILAFLLSIISTPSFADLPIENYTLIQKEIFYLSVIPDSIITPSFTDYSLNKYIFKKDQFYFPTYLTLVSSTNKYKWTSENKILEASFLILSAIDLGQSLYGARHPERFSEGNPILNPHPSPESVLAYFAIAGAVHIGISHLLPNPYRKYFQYITIGPQLIIVIRNFSIGVGISY